MASEIEDTRSLAQYWFEIGFGSCWAEAFVKNGDTPPFELTDEMIEHAWSIAPECAEDCEEFDRRLGQADSVERLTAENAALREALMAINRRFNDTSNSPLWCDMADDMHAFAANALAALSEMAREARS